MEQLVRWSMEAFAFAFFSFITLIIVYFAVKLVIQMIKGEF